MGRSDLTFIELSAPTMDTDEFDFTMALVEQYGFYAFARRLRDERL